MAKENWTKKDEVWTEWDYLFELAESESAADRVVAVIKARTLLVDSDLDGQIPRDLDDSIKVRNEIAHTPFRYPNIKIARKTVRVFYEKWVEEIDESFADTRPIEVTQDDGWDSSEDQDPEDIKYQNDEAELHYIMSCWDSEYGTSFDEQYPDEDRRRQMIIWTFENTRNRVQAIITENPERVSLEEGFCSGPKMDFLAEVLSNHNPDYDIYTASLTINRIEDVAYRNRSDNYCTDIKTSAFILETLFEIHLFLDRDKKDKEINKELDELLDRIESLPKKESETVMMQLLKMEKERKNGLAA